MSMDERCVEGNEVEEGCHNHSRGISNSSAIKTVSTAFVFHQKTVQCRNVLKWSHTLILPQLVVFRTEAVEIGGRRRPRSASPYRVAEAAGSVDNRLGFDLPLLTRKHVSHRGALNLPGLVFQQAGQKAGGRGACTCVYVCARTRRLPGTPLKTHPRAGHNPRTPLQ